jgi:hypothetical protein
MENSTNNTQAQGLQFFNATGIRQPKSVNEDVLIAESTRASFKIMPAVCAKLGIQDGDYVTMQFTKDANGVVDGVYVGKGKNAIFKKDEDGNFMLDERKRKIADVEGFGALASELTPGTNVLKISVASAWDVLGNSDVKKHYTLAEEGVTAAIPIGNGEYHTTILYRLDFLRDEEKVVRASKGEGATKGADTHVSGLVEDQVAQESTQEVASQFTGSNDIENDEF